MCRALDIGCGALGWLRILSEWVGGSGQVLGTDIDESLCGAARSFLDAEGISNVELVVDDLFESRLERQSFDLVHARYVIAPLGRGREQVAAFRQLVRPAGSLVLEEWDLASWHFNPPARAAERLIGLLSEIFAELGGEAGRGLPDCSAKSASRSRSSTRTWSRWGLATPICVSRFSSASRSSLVCSRG